MTRDEEKQMTNPTIPELKKILSDAEFKLGMYGCTLSRKEVVGLATGIKMQREEIQEKEQFEILKA